MSEPIPTLEYAYPRRSPRRHGWHVGVFLPLLYRIMIGVTAVGAWETIQRARWTLQVFDMPLTPVPTCAAIAPPSEHVMWTVESATIPAGGVAAIVLLHVYAPRLRRMTATADHSHP